MLSFPRTDRPLQAEAYELAMIDLARAAPHSVLVPEVMDAVMTAVMDQTAAGQTDAVALARYATSRGQAVYFDQMTR